MTIAKILRLADAHKRDTGEWPRLNSGPVRGVQGETWAAIDAALRNGSRCLRGGSSLARVLAGHRGVRNKSALPRLTQKQILLWAAEHQARTGHWPTQLSGAVVGTSETWHGIHCALWQGLRGLRRGLTLATLIERHRRTIG
jgi:hypothetical protein